MHRLSSWIGEHLPINRFSKRKQAMKVAVKSAGTESIESDLVSNEGNVYKMKKQGVKIYAHKKQRKAHTCIICILKNLEFKLKKWRKTSHAVKWTRLRIATITFCRLNRFQTVHRSVKSVISIRYFCHIYFYSIPGYNSGNKNESMDHQEVFIRGKN